MVWIGLALIYVILLKASELFTEDDGNVYPAYCLRQGDVAFYASECQVEGGSSPETNTLKGVKQ